MWWHFIYLVISIGFGLNLNARTLLDHNFNIIRLILNLVEGFECEDSNFTYKIGKSKYGLWLSRSKKDITVMTTENNSNSNNGPNNENNNNHDTPAPSRPAAFLNDNNSNSESVTSASPITQQQQQQQTTFEYSVKLEETQKNVRVSVHVYSHSKESASKEAIDLLLSTKNELRKKGLRVIESESVGTGEIE
jgi:hypothetical protein